LLVEEQLAKTAERYGLVNSVVPPDQLRNAVKEMAKELINSSTETNHRTGMAHEAEAFGVVSQTTSSRKESKPFSKQKNQSTHNKDTRCS